MSNFIVNNLNYDAIHGLSIVVFSLMIIYYFGIYFGGDIRKATPVKLDILIFSVFFISGIFFLFFYCTAFSVAEKHTLSNLDACTKEQLSSQLSNNKILLNKDVMISSNYCDEMRDERRLQLKIKKRGEDIIESQINSIKSSESEAKK